MNRDPEDRPPNLEDFNTMADDAYDKLRAEEDEEERERVERAHRIGANIQAGMTPAAAIVADCLAAALDKIYAP